MIVVFRVAIFIVIIFGIRDSLIALYNHSTQSQTMILRSYPVVGTTWEGQVRCFLDYYEACGGIDIRLRDRASEEFFTVVVGSDVETALFLSDRSGVLEIYLLSPVIDKIVIPDAAQVHVIISFILHDVSNDQNQYIRWYFQPWRSECREWFCAHALPYPSRLDGTELDRNLARKAYGTKPSSLHYCLSQPGR